MKGIHIDEAAVRAELAAEFDTEYGETAAMFTRDEYVETALTDIKARLEAL
jgi:hypothetical protein